ncbi:TetR/AcrR family transcriptional regulator [Lichenifustis flavocetrariae]|uniref:TetR/AcrR family transcriptional regulator n=1 Tax=Lichenifustis flavocetrariae TaxID=2949735 RepID=A0AA42CR10_9HYPH|nr:TetR/AcrR family transcriptional regulator [Lichenifustis flavocetrariae]MCW6511987.1 TetR/AcrR family transcriptional regulator [Lichenifustis flavocetrariae]
MSATVEAILDVTERRIREAGYHGFSFRTVAAEVGVKGASVHYHFSSKDALAAAVTRRYNERIAKAVDEKVKAGTDVVAAWIDVFRGALSDGTRMCLCGALGITLSDLSPEVVAEVKRFFDQAISSLIAGGVKRHRAIEVLATLEGAILMASVCGDLSTFDEATAALR